MHRDKCKCGRIIVWDSTDKKPVICKHCGTKYRIDMDYQPVHWLKEIVENAKPFETYPK